jgi:hypothetical protein
VCCKNSISIIKKNAIECVLGILFRKEDFTIEIIGANKVCCNRCRSQKEDPPVLGPDPLEGAETHPDGAMEDPVDTPLCPPYHLFHLYLYHQNLLFLPFHPYIPHLDPGAAPHIPLAVAVGTLHPDIRLDSGFDIRLVDPAGSHPALLGPENPLTLSLHRLFLQILLLYLLLLLPFVFAAISVLLQPTVLLLVLQPFHCQILHVP